MPFFIKSPVYYIFLHEKDIFYLIYGVYRYAVSVNHGVLVRHDADDAALARRDALALPAGDANAAA